jgi:hypothetical protein
VKKILVVAAVSMGVLVVVHRFGPALRRMMARKCQEMFDRMPEDFPPKRMMRGIDEVREQSDQILRATLEQRRAADLAPAG